MAQVEKIGWVLIDPNGYCCNSCWYCPRGWAPNPPHARHDMPFEEVTRLMDQCAVRDPEVFASHFHYVGFAEYNEMLLYPQYGQLLEEVSKRRFRTSLFTNGIPLRDDHIELLVEHCKRETFHELRFNIPVADPEIYEQWTGVRQFAFTQMLMRLRKIIDALPPEYVKQHFSIQVNAIDTRDTDGPVILPRAKVLEPAKLDEQIAALRALFPEMNVWRPRLTDRAGTLARYGVISDVNKYPTRDEQVTGCSSDQFRWLHINTRSEAFICCCDYDKTFVYADLTQQTIREAWLGEAHTKMLHKAISTICRTCLSAARSAK